MAGTAAWEMGGLVLTQPVAWLCLGPLPSLGPCFPLCQGTGLWDIVTPYSGVFL